MLHLQADWAYNVRMQGELEIVGVSNVRIKVGHEAKDCWSTVGEDVKLTQKVIVAVQKPDNSSNSTEICQTRSQGTSSGCLVYSERVSRRNRLSMEAS